MRWLIFKSHENGLYKAIVRIGRRVLIDEDAFFEWADQHRHPDAIAKRKESAEKEEVRVNDGKYVQNQ